MSIAVQEFYWPSHATSGNMESICLYPNLPTVAVTSLVTPNPETPGESPHFNSVQVALANRAVLLKSRTR